MNKKYIPTERDIEKLLEKLSADKKPYPTTLLESRKTAYLSYVTSVVNGELFPRDGNSQGQGSPPPASAPMTPIMKMILTTLIAANIILASYLAFSAYDNWDKVQELLFGTPSVSGTTVDSPGIPTQVPESVETPEIIPSPEMIVDPNATPGPSTLTDDSQVDPSEAEVSTPEPDEKDNSGLHLGQTPHAPDNPPGQNNPNDNQGNKKSNDKSGNKDNQGNSNNNNNKNK